jgi:hypothetical protein
MIIAFSGRKFAGKDSTAEGLIRFHGFKRLGLADKLKDICSQVFDVPRSLMDDPNEKEKVFKTPIQITSDHLQCLIDILESDKFFTGSDATKQIYSKFLDVEITSIRNMLQTIGTDLCRTYIQDDIWLSYIKHNIQNDSGNIVITDARFKNERDYLKNMGAILVLVKRDESEPVSKTELHISENQLGSDEDYDVIVHNNDTLHCLQSEIAMWYVLRKDAITSNIKR